MRNIKHQFMAFRNGIVADALRQAGMPYSIIFGLQLPQLSEIARSIDPDDKAQLAQELWADTNVRESRLLAAYLFPLSMPEDEAVAVAKSVLTREEADILAFRFLRRLPYAAELAARLEALPDQLPNYCAAALRRNLEA